MSQQVLSHFFSKPASPSHKADDDRSNEISAADTNRPLSTSDKPGTAKRLLTVLESDTDNDDEHCEVLNVSQHAAARTSATRSEVSRKKMRPESSVSSEAKASSFTSPKARPRIPSLASQTASSDLSTKRLVRQVRNPHELWAFDNSKQSTVNLSVPEEDTLKGPKTRELSQLPSIENEKLQRKRLSIRKKLVDQIERRDSNRQRALQEDVSATQEAGQTQKPSAVDQTDDEAMAVGGAGLSHFAAPESSLTTDSLNQTNLLHSQPKKGKSSQTPLEKQVAKLKTDNPGVLLIIEVGYKMKFFGSDAQKAAKILNIACFKDRGEWTAMIPIERIDAHLRRLLSHGLKVGIVRQTETAALKKAGDNKSGLFERKVTALYTAATYVGSLDSIDDLAADQVQKSQTPAITCIIEDTHSATTSSGDVVFALVSVQPATGDILYDHFRDDVLRGELETRLLYMQPAEILFQPDRSTLTTTKFLRRFASQNSARIEAFDVQRNTDLLERTFGDNHASFIATLEPLIQRGLTCLTAHLEQFGLSAVLKSKVAFVSFRSRLSMNLNAQTLVNLEILQNNTDHGERGSLLWLVDRTQTRFGKRLLRDWLCHPLIDPSALQERLEAVDELRNQSGPRYDALRQVLVNLPDLSKGLCRLAYRRASPKEIVSILQAFERIICTLFVEDSTRLPFQSSTLNRIVSTLSESRDLLNSLLSQIDVNSAQNNDPIAMWKNAETQLDIQDSQDCLAGIQFVGRMPFQLKRSLRLVGAGRMSQVGPKVLEATLARL